MAMIALFVMAAYSKPQPPPPPPPDVLVSVAVQKTVPIVAIDKLKDIRAEQEAQVAAIENSARLSRHRYEVGLSNYLDVLIADQQLFDAEILLARTRGAQLTAVVQLYKALGGGWEETSREAAQTSNP